MSVDDDDLTTELNRELRGRADAMNGSALLLGDVQHKARSIRRRRTASAVLGAAAAVALIVPTAALATHSGDRPEPAPPMTQKPTPTQTTTAAADQQPPRGVLDASDLPTGAAPQLDYLDNGTLHLADGGTAQVNTSFPPTQFVMMADGARVWQTVDQGTAYIEIQDTDGTFHDPVRSTWGMSVNEPHSIVAWLTPSGQVTIWEGWASEPKPLGDPVPGLDLRLGPVTGVGEAVPGKAGPSCYDSVCTVIVNAADSPWQPWEVTESGSQPLRDGSFLSIADQSAAGLSIGLDTVSDSGSCSKLLGGGEFQGFSTCKHTLDAFSPDGALVLAGPAYRDGIGDGQVAIYDLGGKVLMSRQTSDQHPGFLARAVWEDDTHILVPFFQEDTWSIVRMRSDGYLEYAVAPVGGVAEHDPFVLATTS